LTFGTIWGKILNLEKGPRAHQRSPSAGGALTALKEVEQTLTRLAKGSDGGCGEA